MSVPGSGVGHPVDAGTKYKTLLGHQVILREPLEHAVNCEFSDKESCQSYKQCLGKRTGSELTKGDCKKILGPHRHLLNEKDPSKFDVSNLSQLLNASYNSRDRSYQLQKLIRQLKSTILTDGGQLSANLNDVLNETHELHDVSQTERKANRLCLNELLDEPERLKRLYSARKGLEYACGEKTDSVTYKKFLEQEIGSDIIQEKYEKLFCMKRDFLLHTNSTKWRDVECCSFLLAYHEDTKEIKTLRKLWQNLKDNGGKNAGKKWCENVVNQIGIVHTIDKDEIAAMKADLKSISCTTNHIEQALNFILSTALKYECVYKDTNASYKTFLENRNGGPLSKDEYDDQFTHPIFLEKSDPNGLTGTNMCELLLALYKIRDPNIVQLQRRKKEIKQMRNLGIHDPFKANDPQYLSDAKDLSIQFVKDCGKIYKLNASEINASIAKIQRKWIMMTKEEKEIASAIELIINTRVSKSEIKTLDEVDSVPFLDIQKYVALVFNQSLSLLKANQHFSTIVIVSGGNELTASKFLKTIAAHFDLFRSQVARLQDFNFVVYYSLRESSCGSLRDVIETITYQVIVQKSTDK